MRIEVIPYFLLRVGLEKSLMVFCLASSSGLELVTFFADARNSLCFCFSLVPAPFLKSKHNSLMIMDLFHEHATN